MSRPPIVEAAFERLELQGHAQEWKIEPLHTSRVWHLRAQNETVDSSGFEDCARHLAGAPVFLVQHDWHALCQHIDGYELGEFQLPFDDCVFELCAGGLHLIAYLQFRADEEPQFSCSVFVKSEELRDLCSGAPVDWLFFPYTTFYLVDGEWFRSDARDCGAAGVIEQITNQVRAVSVLTEVGILEARKVEPSAKLQKARQRRGKPRLNEYLQLGLRRSSVTQPASKQEYQGVVRCHFRRGHWANLHGKRVWRKWTIVGNPDLGFVDKRYVLGAVT